MKKKYDLKKRSLTIQIINFGAFSIDKNESKCPTSKTQKRHDFFALPLFKANGQGKVKLEKKHMSKLG